MIRKHTPFLTPDKDPGSNEGGGIPDIEEAEGGLDVEFNGSETGFSPISEIHQSLVTPSSITIQPDAVRLGDQWVKSLWVAEYPENPLDGFLQEVLASPETRDTDIAIHIVPRDTEETLDSIENRIEDLEADYEYLNEKHRASARGVKKDLRDYQDIYDVLRNTSMEAFDVSTYLAVRGENRDKTGVEGVMEAARHAPANLTPVQPRWMQFEALVSTSPTGLDRLGEKIDTESPMLGGAVGAHFPFISGSYAEPGIELGTYAVNGSPLILDRYRRETGYCSMVIGCLGAGKSFAAKLRILRRAMYDSDTIIVVLDPMKGFRGVAEALNATRVTVGGTRGLNPLEIQPTPKHVLEGVEDIDPWGEQITWVMTFLATFFKEIADNPLGGRSQTLRRAVQEAYQEKGITRDPDSHTKESPTIRDVISALERFAREPGSYGYVTEGERSAVREDAESLLKDMRPSFRPNGELANLATPTEFDLSSRFIYLDLHQEEGLQGKSETSLTMQVLFNLVYERVKQSDRKVLFVIDEAHYLMNDAASLGFLETAVRHSRHFDLSMEFITQTGGEFALTPEARTIASLCSLTILHRVNEERDKIKEWFDLNPNQVDWVASAKAGEEEAGYSEALIGIDQMGWYPVRVHASSHETELITQANQSVQRS